MAPDGVRSKTYAELAREIELRRDSIIEHERSIHFLKSEINAIIDSAPDTFRKRYRICNMCQEYTLERISVPGHSGCTCCLPQCAKHTKSKDATAVALLREAFFGLDNDPS